jgi:hypothetical protein
MLKPVRTAAVVLGGVLALGLGVTSAPPPAVAQGWVAVAADGKGRWGYAFGQRTQAQARGAALKGCGGGECNIEGSAQARCFAYVESRAGGYWYGVGIGRRESAVLATARHGCGLGAPAGTCKVVKAACG